MSNRLLKHWVQRLAYGVRQHPRLSRVALAVIPDIERTMRIPEIGPFRMRVRRHRYLWLRGPAETERFPFVALRALVRPGDLVLDGGANIGLYARYLVSVCGAGCVVCFEPWAENVQLLSKNLGLGAIEDRVRIISCALARTDGEERFQVDDIQSTSGTLDQVTSGRASEGRANLRLEPRVALVPCRSIDSLLLSGELEAPAVIKLDVEGAEALVLEGARGCLQTHAPRLVVELHGADVAREVMRMLLGLGYSGLASVQPHIDPRGVATMDARLVETITGPYDALFLAASRDERDLRALPELLTVRSV